MSHFAALPVGPPDVLKSSISSSSTAIVLADDCFAGRQDLIRVLSKEPGLILVRCAGSLGELLSNSQRLAPCVLIVGERMVENADPAEFVGAGAGGRSIQVLVVGSRDAPAAIERLLRTGCMGFVPESCSRTVLRRAIRSVSSGEIWASRLLVSRLVRRLLSESIRKLTRREQQILELIGQGYKNREIADQLKISRETVRWHVRSLYGKIGVDNRLGAALYAVNQLGLDSPSALGVARKPPGEAQLTPQTQATAG